MLDLVIDVSMRAAGAALAVGIILRLLRIRSATLRHTAWTSVMLLMLALPLLTVIVPRVAVPVPSTLALDLGTIAAPEPIIFGPAETPTDQPPVGATAARAVRTNAGPASAPEPRTQAFTPGSSSAPALATLYFGGLLFMAGRLAAGWTMARRLRRSAMRVELREATGIYESAAVLSPLTVGILRPMIVLPSTWRSWRAEKLRAVLAHEQAHASRRDGLTAFLAEANRAIFWFHPLAWWLPRMLAAEAEHACDDAAAQSRRERREYAEVLVEIAESVAAGGRRIAWHAMGVTGTGRLGARIDRLLHGAPARPQSRGRVTAAAGACALVLVSAIACRQQPAPLQPDPELAERYAEQARNAAEFQSAINMTLDEVDALEQRIDANPSDWEARERLVTYYRAGTKVPWERKVPGLRKHALWLIEHHPEHEIDAPPLSPQYDPEGFAEAVRLWEHHLQNEDASPFLVYRAARFFAPYDRPRAEQLILRGMAMDPASEALAAKMPPRVGGYHWSTQLGFLYSRALLGSESYYPTLTHDPKAASTPFAKEVRRKLEDSRDARLLARVGSEILRARSNGEPAAEMRTIGREYLERALQIDPGLESARVMLARADRAERHERIWHAVTQGGDVPDEDRLAYLANKASYAYMELEAAESWRKNANAAKNARDDAKTAAEAVLALAAERRGSPDYAAAVMTAHQTLGLIALHDGDREAAVHHMLQSVKVPELGATESILEAGFVAQRLPTYLLKEGERESVIQYYEAAAKINPRERDALLEHAKAVREGRMTRNYQATFGRSRQS